MKHGGNLKRKSPPSKLRYSSTYQRHLRKGERFNMSKLNELIAKRNEIDEEIRRERKLAEMAESELIATDEYSRGSGIGGVINVSPSISVGNIAVSVDESVRTNYNKTTTIDTKLASGDSALSSLSGLFGNFFKKY